MTTQNKSTKKELEKKEFEIEKLYRSLTIELRSVVQKSNQSADCKCLVRFHNCTPYRVTPFWLDFKGLPIKYPTLLRGASINIDTFVSHLWFFKTDDSDGNRQSEPMKILAIPEETIDINIKQSLQKPEVNSDTTNSDLHTVQEAILGANNVLICSLCKFLLRHLTKTPTKVPCPHFTGEAKFSVSDLEYRSLSNYNSTYIYSCTESTHRREHSLGRRNIYLVEPFLNLRERCFLALKNRINHVDIVDLKLPVSLQKEYLQFITTLRKLDGNNKSSV